MSSAIGLPLPASQFERTAPTPDEFRAGMRRLATGVTLITTVHDGRWYGFAATAVTSVSADPPSLLVSMNRRVSSHDAFMEAGVFCVNVLSRQDKHLAEMFSSPLHRNERFADNGWHAGHTGCPVLRRTLVSFECRKTRSFAIHTHSLLIGEITAVHIDEEDIDPLLYFDGDYHDAGPALA